MHTHRPARALPSLLIAALLPLAMGAEGDGCAANHQTPAPDVSGTWAIAYDDTLDIRIDIGGAVYTETVGPDGGTVTIEHQGHPLRFDLDCARPEILCPSEAWPETVSISQPEPQYPHRMRVLLPQQRCDGALVAPAPEECGPGTLNPDCEQVCDGEIHVDEVPAFGSIGASGDSFRLLLGAGIATNGLNCALLGWSVADAELETEGAAGDGTWEATAMHAGLVTVGYAGGCLWAGDPDMDGELEALVLGASVELLTGFTGARL